MGPEFFQTGMGRKFYEVDVPDLIRAINRQAAAIEKQNEFTERICALQERQISALEETNNMLKESQAATNTYYDDIEQMRMED